MSEKDYIEIQKEIEKETNTDDNEKEIEIYAPNIIATATASNNIKEENLMKEKVKGLKADNSEDASHKVGIKRNVPKFIVSLHPAEQVFSEEDGGTNLPRGLLVSSDKSDVFVYFGRENIGEDDIAGGEEEIYDKVLTKYDRETNN